jgi:predicted nucleotidyltransferase
VHGDVIRVSKSLGIDISALIRASDHSQKQLDKFRRELHQKFASQAMIGIDLVVHGSYAREEATSGSDFDYIIVINSLPKPKLIQDFIKEVERIREEEAIKGPGREGLFGEIVVAGELFTRIGLESDTNATTTRRMLLLTESVSAYDESVHDSVLTATIERYCFDHHEDDHDLDPSRIPRFLLNDLIRYWRTIAVDFGAKRWRLLGHGGHLRLAKLRCSRKLMIAGSLASVFQTPKMVTGEKNLSTYLLEEFKKPALARLAGAFDFL